MPACATAKHQSVCIEDYGYIFLFFSLNQDRPTILFLSAQDSMKCWQLLEWEKVVQ